MPCQQVGLKVQSAPDNGGVCLVTGCIFQDGSSKFQCQDAACSCSQGACPCERLLPAPKNTPDSSTLPAAQNPEQRGLGAADIASYTALIEGNSVEVECTANGTCTVNIANFPVQVSLPCTFGDCQSPDNPALFSSELLPRNASAHHRHSADRQRVVFSHF